MSEKEKAGRLARLVLSREYGLEGELTALAGYSDDNFLVTMADGKQSVLKIMHKGCPSDVVDMQAAALRHVREHAPDIAVPALIVAGDGAAVVEIEDCLAWMVGFCSGVLLAEFRPHDAVLLERLGESVADLDNALTNFDHPALRRGHRWELTRAARIRSFCQHIEIEFRDVADRTLRRFAHSVLPQLADLPHGVIHNDVNDYNVLVARDTDGRATISGLIDFGDLTWQPVVCELAIVCAYACLHKDRPLQACASVVRGYQRKKPLGTAELDVLFELIKTRLAVSIAISSERHRRRPDDAYTVISQKPAMAALAMLDAVPEGRAGIVITQAAR